VTEPHKSPLHKDALHESGYRHASGEAIYIDDIPTPPKSLVGYIVVSPIAHGVMTLFDASAAKTADGIHAILSADDIPGVNNIAPVLHDEPLLAKQELHCVGQHIALIVGESLAACRNAAKLIRLEFDERPGILNISDAIEQESFLTAPHIIRRGNVEAALDQGPHHIQGTVHTGAQDHFYLETQAALALLDEQQTFLIHSSTQHPSEVQAKVAEVLNMNRGQIVVQTRRMGGGFGGKETQAAPIAALAALGALKTGRPVKVLLNRDQDMMQTGKRHPFYSEYEASFTDDGMVTGLKVKTYADGGWSSDLSQAILDRCLFHLDNAYYIPNLEFVGTVVRTNLVSNTAFRGFGGPQGVVVIEEILNRIAHKLDLDSAQVRAKNFYEDAPRNETPYGQKVEDCRLKRLYTELMDSSDYANRRRAIDDFNANSAWIKRGIAFQPVKFGISFTHSVLNQAGAMVVIYSDGTVQLNHGGTEMGQGLHTKMLAICAHALGVKLENIRMMDTSTDKVPNTSATAASSGSDLNGQAVRAACETLKQRLRPIAAKELNIEPHHAEDIRFSDGQIHAPGGENISFADLALTAYESQISLAATGYYATPGIHYDRDAGRGKPFHYFAYGAAVLEVEMSGLTGEHKVKRADILHDAGHSLIPSIDRGQVEGAFIQGLGWLSCEEVLWSKSGQLNTHSPDTYKIPAISDAPEHFTVQLLQRAPQHDVIHGSKAVGEPPFILGIGILGALRHAIASFLPQNRLDFALNIPCTPESVLRAVEDLRKKSPRAQRRFADEEDGHSGFSRSS
jgi:xanthine dehydrogenase large subunit